MQDAFRTPSRALLLVLVLAGLAIPATAHAMTREAVGYGTVHVAGATECTSPQSTAGGTNANVNAGTTYSCGAIADSSYDNCSTPDINGSYACDITVQAQEPDSAGWHFDHWSGDCSTETTASCTLETSDHECDPELKPPCHTFTSGPYTVVAHFVDTRAPATTYSTAPSNNTVVYSDTQSQTFSWSTNEDGENPAFGCKKDAGSFSACSSGLTWSSIADGIHDFCVHGTDASGLQGVDTCRHWEQETNTTASISTHPASLSTNGSPGFTYTSNKAGRSDGSSLSYQCKLDGGAFASCPSSGTSYGSLADGSHTFQVQAVFTGSLGGGAHTSAAASYTWTQDTTPPVVTVGSGPADGSVLVDSSGHATFGFTASDATSGPPSVVCKLDGGAYGSCTSATSDALSSLSDGEHDFSVKATDGAGLTTTQTIHWEQETPADAVIDSGPAAGAPVSSGAAHFAFHSNKADRPVTFQCALDSNTFAACSGAGSDDVSGLAEGSHTLQVRAVFTASIDGSQHAGAAVSRTWTVDTTPPDTAIAAGPADGLATSDQTAAFTFTASEPGSFRCTLDGAASVSCGSPRTLSGLAIGAHTFTVAAVDAAGNVDPTPATRSWRVIAGGTSATDADRDGYPASVDCNDHDASIHPGAADTPGDGVDQNCDGHDAAVPAIGANVTASWRFFTRYTKLSSLNVQSVPAGAKIAVTCKGRRSACKFSRKTIRVRSAAHKVTLAKYFKKAKLANGTKIKIVVTKPGMVGLAVTYTTRNGKLPAKSQASVR